MAIMVMMREEEDEGVDELFKAKMANGGPLIRNRSKGVCIHLPNTCKYCVNTWQVLL